MRLLYSIHEVTRLNCIKLTQDGENLYKTNNDIYITYSIWSKVCAIGFNTSFKPFLHLSLTTPLRMLCRCMLDHVCVKKAHEKK